MLKSVIDTLQPLKRMIKIIVRTISALMMNSPSTRSAVDALYRALKTTIRPLVYHKALDTIEKNNSSPKGAVGLLCLALKKTITMTL